MLKNNNLHKAPVEYNTGNVSAIKDPIRPLNSSYQLIHETTLPNGLKYTQHKKDQTYFHRLHSPDHSEPLAEIYTKGEDPEDTSSVQNHSVGWSQVHPNFKGKGLGKQLYLATLVHGKGVGRLVSDVNLSKPAHKVWLGFKKIKGLGGKIGKYSTIKQMASDPIKGDMAFQDTHEVFIKRRSNLDHNQMFPKVDLGTPQNDKLAASENSLIKNKTVWSPFTYDYHTITTIDNNYLIKSEDMWDDINDLEDFYKNEDYKSIASKSLMLGYPVSIAGQTHRDNGIHHHMTIKVFEGPDVDHQQVQDTVSKLEMPHIDPKQIKITAHIFKDRTGQPVHSLVLHGSHLDTIKSLHETVNHLGIPHRYAFAPHISVDAHVYDRIKSMNNPTAYDAGIRFGHPELKLGPNTLAQYKAKSEVIMDSLEKNSFKQMLGGLTAAAILGTSTPIQSTQHVEPTKKISQAVEEKKSKIKNMLRAIALVESNAGQNTNHKPVFSKKNNRMETAYGHYGLMPDTIKDVVSKNPEHFKGHEALLSNNIGDIHNHLDKHPELQHKIAKKHLERMSKVFNNNLAAIGYGWFNGVTGTKRAIKQGKDISNHWHVQKIKNAYKQVKNENKRSSTNNLKDIAQK